MKNIAVNGKTSRFGKILAKFFYGKNIYYVNKNELDILNEDSINKYIKKKNIKILIHLAGLSRPMKIHEKNIAKSINLNIIGTSNVVKACQKNKVKLIYFSTNYVYPCKRGPYSENSSLNPINNYGWSKLGGESAVKMYKNSLILRLCMTEKPFIHKKAFSNVISSFIYHEDFAKNFKKIINQKGVINVGGKRQSVFSFVSKNNKNIKPILSKDKFLDNSINIKKYRKLVK
tara:strand:+ start:204 stop:896 length:693 start_codon:yes stop_codon:yes gene_type:complete